MEKATHLTPVLELVRRIPSINFPEYQREPNVWSRIEKQRLIDSIIRRFDIASIYLYVDEEGATDCIDGRQRLGAIMSFMGLNPEDSDNGFDFRILNEIGQDEDHPFQALDIRDAHFSGAPGQRRDLSDLDPVASNHQPGTAAQNKQAKPDWDEAGDDKCQREQ